MLSVRILMQKAAQEDLILHQMDVKTAYLHAPIDCEIYLEQPQGYEKNSNTGEKLGQVAETMNMAALWKLPVIFACENNGYAKGTSMGRCTVNTDFYKRGDVIPGLRVDGMDVLCVREAARFASDHCRSGKVSFLFNKMEHLSMCRFISTCPFLVSQGPIIMELQTYRFFGHAIGDTEHKYRTADEVDEVRKERDPIYLLEGHLIRNNIATMEELREINEKSVKDVEEAAQFAIQSPEPLVEELCSYIYCNNPPFKIRGINPWTKLKSSM
ncbi:pyruvate dehydrogenase E1 component subunit alpha, somatic form, mitochondrial-like isoform X1 [Entelurus aequoreus]|uniref:pyruvate dehydrogenase E1 component subunit alpha, somatic form, mitochondrial-like isoform X1 n=1 Tax=Entelurus aequoreus TaxID=161455 RepID=UPI002B1E4724|nr:pyruvate dehydrogenase E1 component subunit alpha, somatic form, mitochondrial-like isoform X1 [Entelurus aequoreus]